VIGLLAVYAIARVVLQVRGAAVWLGLVVAFLLIGLLVDVLSVPDAVDLMSDFPTSSLEDLQTAAIVEGVASGVAVIFLLLGMRRVAVEAQASGSRTDLRRVTVATVAALGVAALGVALRDPLFHRPPLPIALFGAALDVLALILWYRWLGDLSRSLDRRGWA
jgi:hypothetical protein